MVLVSAFRTSRLLLATAALALAGCAANPVVPPPPPSLFHDALFRPPALPVQPAQALATSPAMRDFLGREAARMRLAGPGFGLVDSLLDSGVLRLDYDADMTRTAAEAFDARTGNCLSLVMMTAALAKEMGLRVVYRQIETGGMWSRSGTLLMNLAHVNISIARDRVGSSGRSFVGDWVTIDFMPDAASAHAPRWELDEARILAMYLNNRAAEHMAAGSTDEAYWQARAAIETDAAYVDAYNTLGVVYLRHGRPDEAVTVLRHALTRDATHRHALGNLAGVLDQTGRPDEAAELRAQLRRVEQVRPFQDYEEGLRAMEAGDHGRARTLFQRELRRNALQFDELHLNLARVHLHFKEYGEARRQLEKALELSTTRQRQAIYAAKLQALDAERRRQVR